MVTIFVIIAAVVCATLGLIRPRLHPYLIYLTGLALVLQTTLAGNALIGGDIHVEYWYASWYSGLDVWPPDVIYPQGTSISNSYILPFLYSMGIPIDFSMKFIYPLLYSLLPVILYYIFKVWLNPTESFLSSFFFISVSPFFLEIPTIPRQMLAMPLFALFLLISLKPMRHKIPSLIIIAILTTSLHYTMGIILTIMLLTSLISTFTLRGIINKKQIIYTLISLLLFETFFFGFSYNGAVFKKLASIVPSKESIVKIGPVEAKVGSPTQITSNGDVEKPRLEYFEPLVEAGLGLDFLKASGFGKIFRVLQFATEVLMLGGLWVLMRRKNKEYFIWASGLLLLLLLAVTYNRTAIVVGPSRLYNLILILLAPALVLGFKVLVKDVRFLLIILIPYFLFTSGFVFEVAKQEDISKINIPYSLYLSNDRIDLGTNIEVGDLEVRDYVKENGTVRVLADLYGTLFLSEILGVEDPIGSKISEFPEFGGLEGTTKPYYVFLRGKNVREGKIITWIGPGMRASRNVPEFKGRLIYKAGDSELWEVR